MSTQTFPQIRTVEATVSGQFLTVNATQVGSTVKIEAPTIKKALFQLGNFAGIGIELFLIADGFTGDKSGDLMAAAMVGYPVNCRTAHADLPESAKKHLARIEEVSDPDED